MRTVEIVEAIGAANLRSEQIFERSHFATDSVAYNLSRAYTANPYLNRKILTTLAINGMNEQQINQIGNIATKRMLADGVVPDGAPPRAPEIIAPRVTPQFPSFADEFFNNQPITTTFTPTGTSATPVPESNLRVGASSETFGEEGNETTRYWNYANPDMETRVHPFPIVLTDPPKIFDASQITTGFDTTGTSATTVPGYSPSAQRIFSAAQTAAEGARSVVEYGDAQAAGLPVLGYIYRGGRTVTNKTIDSAYYLGKSGLRNAMIGAESGWEFGTNVAGLYFQQRQRDLSMTFEEQEEFYRERGAFRGIWEDVTQIGRAAEATQVGQVVRNLIRGEDAGTGSGFFASQELRGQQAEAQKDLLGTLTGPEGEELIYTVGRGMLSDANGEAITENSLLYSLGSGMIDGTLALIFDPTKKLPYIGWGKRYAQGLPTPRREAEYFYYQKIARQLSDDDPVANANAIEYAMLQALRAIGVEPGGRIGSRNILNRSNRLDEAEISTRAILHDQLGMLGTPDNPTFLRPDFAKWLTSEDALRTLEYLARTGNQREIAGFLGNKVGPKLSTDLKNATSTDEVLDIMGRALANPGKELENQLRLFPTMGVFNVREKGLWIKRNLNGYTRAGNYLPVGIKVMFNDPTNFMKQWDMIFRSFPVARHQARVLGERAAPYDKNFLDRTYNEMAEAFAYGSDGDIYNVVQKGEQMLNEMFQGMGFTVKQSNALTRLREDLGNLNAFMQADLAAGVGESVISRPLAISQLLSDGIFIVDPAQLQTVLRQAATWREFSRKKLTRFGRYNAERYDLAEDLANLQDDVFSATESRNQLVASGTATPDEILEADTVLSNLISDIGIQQNKLSKVDEKIDVLESKKLTGQDARFAERTEKILEGTRYYWKSSTIARVAYVTRVLPEEVARVLASGAFDGVADYILTITPDAFGGFAGRYSVDAAGNAIVTSSRKSHKIEIAFDTVNDEIQSIVQGLQIPNLSAKPKNMPLENWVLSLQNPSRVLDQASESKLLELINRRQTLSSELDQSYLELDLLAQGLRKAQIGSDRARSLGVVMRERVNQLAATGHFKIADRRQPAQIQSWADGLGDKLSFYSQSEDMVVNATMMNPLSQLNFRDLEIAINGVDDTIVGHFKAGRIQNVEDWLGNYYHSGPGREYWEAWYKSLAATGDVTVIGKIPEDVVEDAIEWVIKQTEELSYLAGGANNPRGQQQALMNVTAADGNVYEVVPSLNGFDSTPQILEMIETGRFEGRPLRGLLDPGKNRTGYSERFKEMLDEFLLDYGNTNPNAPLRLHYDTMTIHGERTLNVWENVMGAFFQGFYGVSSDILARNPLWKRTYWNQIADMVDMVDSATAAKILTNAEEAGVPKKMLEKIRARAGANIGGDEGADFEIIDKMARVAAVDYTADLLYDANKRGATADALRYVIAFADAMKEVYSTWAVLLGHSYGKPAIRVGQAIEAGRKATAIGPGDIYGIDPETGEPTAQLDGVPEGFIFNDPTSGEPMFQIPFSGPVIQKVLEMFGSGSGDANAESPFTPGFNPSGTSASPVTSRNPVKPKINFDVPLRNVNIFGQLSPGLMPGASQAVNYLMPDSPEWNGIREFVNPYGRQTFNIFPVWLRRVSAIFEDNDFTKEFAGVIGNSESDPVFQRMRNHLINQKLSERAYNEEGVVEMRYPTGVQGFEQLIQDAKKDSFVLQFLRGVANFIGPGAPLIRYAIETEEGNVNAALVMSELRRESNALIEEGQNPDLAMINILEDYGPWIYGLNSPINKTNQSGIDGSVEWREWYQGNKDFVNEYKDVGAFFGPTGAYDQTSLSELERAGLYQPMSPEEKLETLATRTLFLRLNRFRDKFPPESKRSLEQRRQFNQFRSDLEKFWGVSTVGQGVAVRVKNNLQMQEMERIMDLWVGEGDMSLAPIMETPTGDALIDYMSSRSFFSQQAVRDQNLVSDGWKTANKAAPYRDELRSIGEALAESDSGFSRLWFTVLSRELGDQEDGIEEVPIVLGNQDQTEDMQLRAVSGPPTIKPPRFP